MAYQDAHRTRPRRLRDASKITSDPFDSEVAPHIPSEIPVTPPHGFQKSPKTFPRRLRTTPQQLKRACCFVLSDLQGQELAKLVKNVFPHVIPAIHCFLLPQYLQPWSHKPIGRTHPIFWKHGGGSCEALYN